MIRVSRDIIWSTLQHHLPSTLFHLIRHMFDDVQIVVILPDFQSRYICSKKGVLQGSILSLLLYAVFIDTLPRRLHINMLVRCDKPLISRSTFKRDATGALGLDQKYKTEKKWPTRKNPPRYQEDNNLSIIICRRRCSIRLSN